MQGIGGLLVLLGAGSFLLPYLGLQFILVSWIDNWGTAVGNGIRIAMIVVGVILWFMGRQQPAKTENPPA
jgi:Na+-transporting NADH:ubiquinone oxidoreductase subunit NqrB